MSQIINTNIASINAQRNLSNSQSDLGVSLERLSSGLRINSAADDAAGLAISERFTAQITGLNQASRNASDGISFAQTAEGALGEVGNSLQRIRELAVQSANDTNSAGDREALDNEVQELISEVNRIAESSEFNGQNILDGSLEELVFQVGANANQTITSDGVDVTGDSLGARVLEGIAVEDAGDTLGDLGEDALTINGIDVDVSDVSSIAEVVGQVNQVANESGVTARQDSQTQAVLGDIGDTDDESITINGSTINIDGLDDDEVVQAINDASSRTGGVRASMGDDGLVLTSSSSSIDIEAADDVFDDGDFSDGVTFEAGIVLEGDVGREINIGGDDDAAQALFGVDQGDIPEGEDRTLNDSVDVLTRASATQTIEVMDSALNQVNSARSELGAVQSRFESTIANLDVSSENLTAARSRIQDADFAEETAALTRGQILQQAGTSVLSQANQIPQNTLSLLQ
ncbi:flagellin [Aquisalimonas asiatica]|uniref:Flagellin n=1 Tax=Aquisalimonas asiatica TaxID=406100 RepID=A0A1H8QU80_9GAMM|nr:flagellin [Aquisalimonas asiatica]SEO57488.1 flagellin [Aquisalimonas asiatica]